MDYQVLFNWASGALTTMALLVVTLVITLLRGLFADLTAFREEVAKDYLRKDDFNRVADRYLQNSTRLTIKLTGNPANDLKRYYQRLGRRYPLRRV